MGIFHKKRIRSAYKFLAIFFKEGDLFRVGIPFQTFQNCSNLEKYGLSSNFQLGKKQTPNPVKPISKANKNGKWVRIQPTSYVTVTRHIKYIRKKDKQKIEFDRDFYVYKKSLHPAQNMDFEFAVSGDGEQMVVSELLTFSEEEDARNTHIINLFCEIFEEFEPILPNFEFAIPIDRQFSEEILPAGSLTDERIYNGILSTANKYLSNDEQINFTERLDFLQEFDPQIIGVGKNGTEGYIIFDLEKYGVALLEKPKYGNATYIFKLENYKAEIFKDKQVILREKQFLKRILHKDNWKNRIQTYLNMLKK